MNTEFTINQDIAKQETKGVLKVKETLKDGGWIFFDVDGTLEDKNGVPEELIQTLQKTASNGIEIGICTGRAPGDLAKLLDAIDPYDPPKIFTGWKLLEDSHVIVEPGKTIDQAITITSPETQAELAALEQRFLENWYASEVLGKGWGFLKDVSVPPVKLSPHPHLGTLSIWEKGPYESPEYANVMAWTQQAVDDLGLQTLELLEAGDGSLRVFQKGINKGTGLQNLADKGLIDLSKTVYFGDANNDLSAAGVVLDGGGAVVAVANATKGFKSIATHTTFQKAGAGVVEVIKQF